MNSVNDRLVHIDACRGITWKRIKRFFLVDRTLKSVYNFTCEQLVNMFEWNKKSADQFINDLHSIPIKRILRKYKRENIIPITIFDQKYPPLLKQIYEPPWVLYTKGNISFLQDERNVSIVGTRNPTKYGVRCLQKIAKPFIDQEWMITSGLAYGIDTEAHLQAIMRKGKTIAVLGSGFYHVYPKRNIALSKIIANKHLLISEYAPHKRPYKWNFPMRNRIISGLSFSTLVIEAKKQSGSLITANQALAEGREVFAVPGSILTEQAIGTNELIQAGAQLAMSGEQMINHLTPMLEKN